MHRVLANLVDTLSSLGFGIAIFGVITAASIVGVVLPQPVSFDAGDYYSKFYSYETPAREALVQKADLADSEARRRIESREPTEDDLLRLFYVDKYSTLGRLFLALEFHRVFWSWWFLTGGVLLAASLVCCVTKRLGSSLRTALLLRPPTEPPSSFEVLIRLEPDEAARRLQAVLRARGFISVRGDAPGGIGLAAQRGMFSRLGIATRLDGIGRLGPLVAHSGVIMVMLAGIAYSRLSFRVLQYASPGDTIHVPDLSFRYEPLHVLRRILSGRPSPAELMCTTDDWRKSGDRRPAFSVRVDGVLAEFTPEGQPKLYRTAVTVLDPEPVYRHDIEVNRPLVYRGVHFYQSAYDTRTDGRAEFEVRKLGDGAWRRRVTLAPGDEVELERGVTLRSLRYVPNFRMDAAGNVFSAGADAQNPAVRLAVNTAARPAWFFFKEEFKRFTTRLGDYEIEPLRLLETPRTGLSIRIHPGLGLVWIGCALTVLGLVLCFYFDHWKVMVYVRPAPEGSWVSRSLSAHKWSEDLRATFDSALEEMSK